MNKSNSKRLYRFVKEQARKEATILDDSFDALTKPSNSAEFFGTAEKPPQAPNIVSHIKSTHVRSQTYPIPLDCKEESCDYSQIRIKCPGDTASQHSMENQTVIVRDCPSEETELRRQPKKEEVRTVMAGLRLRHQMKTYELREAMAEAQEEQQRLAIKERVLENLLRECISQNIYFG
jgi:hypothetical protein